jgi:hypothetical protein
MHPKNAHGALMTDIEKLWTCIAKCQVCKKELNRALHVPEHAKVRVCLSAPLVSICDKKQHNTLSDCNIGVELEWVEEECVYKKRLQ